MIRTLRRRHLAIFIALAIILPILFWAGIAARKPIAVMKSLPPTLAPGH